MVAKMDKNKDDNPELTAQPNTSHGRSFAQNCRLASSRIVKRNKNAHKCTNCRKGFSTNIQLLAHQCRRSKNPKWECRICCHITISMKSLIEHLTHHYSQEIQFRCPVPKCGKGFFYISSFEQHIKTHYGYKCIEPTCSRREKSFAARCSLEDHVKKHLDIRKFSCDICPNRRFSNKSGLNSHKKSKMHIATVNWLKMHDQHQSDGAK